MVHRRRRGVVIASSEDEAMETVYSNYGDCSDVVEERFFPDQIDLENLKPSGRFPGLYEWVQNKDNR